MAATDLQGKVAVITGATTGIGEATAIEFAKYRAKLVLCGRNLEGLIDTKQQCVKQGLADTDIAIVTGDICQDETLDLIVKTSIEKFNKVDILFLNAGKGHYIGDTVLNPDTVESLDFYYQIFIKSPYKLTQKLSAELIKAKGSIVINSAGASSELVSPKSTAYSVMKAGQNQMARLFALTFANKGVRVNAIRPGPVKTNILSELGDENARRISDRFKVMAEMTPLGQCMATCEETARVVVFLSSSQSACMTGQLITTDKGFTMTHPAVDWKQF